MNTNNFIWIRISVLIMLTVFMVGCYATSKEKKVVPTLQENNYPAQKLPLFFKQLIQNHKNNFHNLDSTSYQNFIQANHLKKASKENFDTYYTLKILHTLFTSRSAKNQSTGELLPIPYFWHWVQPNPRHEIIYNKTKEKLATVKSPKEFSKYQSYADIDRIPSLFLADLALDDVKYSHPDLGEFKTFGWCSEREMAFVCLLKTWQYNAQVITKGNHSWTECIIPLKSNAGEINFKVTIDNTFDKIYWEKITTVELKTWAKQKNDGLGDWYNSKASSEVEIQKTKQLIISEKASNYIEKQVVTYLKNKNN